MLPAQNRRNNSKTHGCIYDLSSCTNTCVLCDFCYNWITFKPFKTSPNTNLCYISVRFELRMTMAESLSWCIGPLQTKQKTLERNTGSTCKGAWGLTEPQVPHNSSYNLIKILTGTLATNGRATAHLYSQHCGVSSCWEMELF